MNARDETELTLILARRGRNQTPEYLAQSSLRPQRSEKKGENHSKEYLSCPFELGAFAPWREKHPNPRTFDLRNIQTARYNKHVGAGFRIAMQYEVPDLNVPASSPPSCPDFGGVIKS